MKRVQQKPLVVEAMSSQETTHKQLERLADMLAKI
jgi:hypothetical protein